MVGETPGACVLAEVVRVRGSAPREVGAWMVVGTDTQSGTIGGGRLELMAVEAARALLRGADGPRVLDVALGPELGQCCGGRVAVALTPVDAAQVRARRAAEAAARPVVHIHGAGHVGRALAAALALLPVRVAVIDGRAEWLAGLPGAVLSAVPEAEVRTAPPGTAHVVLTHDHALDFLIAAEVLARGDAAYAGMIGSVAKRAAFARFARARGIDPGALVCPIGGPSGDKRPAVIAALVAAEVMTALSRVAVHQIQASGARA